MAEKSGSLSSGVTKVRELQRAELLGYLFVFFFLVVVGLCSSRAKSLLRASHRGSICFFTAEPAGVDKHIKVMVGASTTVREAITRVCRSCQPKPGAAGTNSGSQG